MTPLTNGLNAIGGSPASWKLDPVTGEYGLVLDWNDHGLKRKKRKGHMAVESVADVERRTRANGGSKLSADERKRYAQRIRDERKKERRAAERGEGEKESPHRGASVRACESGTRISRNGREPNTV